MSNPLVSIVLPTWNGEQWLAESIQSVLTQTYINFELIIVNDCSMDSTESIVLSFRDERIKYIKNAQNLKLPASLNVGFAHAKGKYFTWTSDDNHYKPKALEILVNFLEQHDDIDFVYGNQDIIDEHGDFIREQVMKTEDWIPVHSIFGAYFMYRNSLHYKIGGYATNWFVVEDFQFVLAAYNLGFKFKKIEENQYQYRVHNQSLSTIKRKYQAECIFKLCFLNLQQQIDKYDKNTIMRIFAYLLEVSNMLSDIEKAKKVLQLLGQVGMNEVEAFISQDIKNWLSRKQNFSNTEIECRRYTGEKMKIIFWGAGYFCTPFLSAATKSGLKVDYIVDSDASKRGTYVNGIAVYETEKLESEDIDDTLVFITVTTPEVIKEIRVQLEKLGYVDNVFEAKRFFVLDNLLYFCSTIDEIHGLETGYQVHKHTSQNILVENSNSGKIYRLIAANLADELKIVYDRAKDIIDAGDIVNTKLVEGGLYNYETVFEHAYLSVLTYCYEMSPVMFKDMVLWEIDFIEKLERNRLVLTDAHCMNVTFYKGRFVNFDFDAIRCCEERETNYFQFITWNINVLLLFGKGVFDKAYMYLKNFDNMCTRSDLLGYLSPEEIGEYDEIMLGCLRGRENKFNILRQYVNKISENIYAESIWKDYQVHLFNNLFNESMYSEKQKGVMELVRKVHPKTMIDLAGNQGIYSILLHNELDYAITADKDTNCIDFAYQKVRELGIDNVYPVLLDVICPSTAYYKDRQISNDSVIIPWRESSFNRFKSEMVLALAVVHHLVLAMQISFDELVGQLALFSEKYLLVEWIEREDVVVKDALERNDSFVWYTKDNFEKALKVKFNILQTRNSEKTRILYLCEKR